MALAFNTLVWVAVGFFISLYLRKYLPNRKHKLVSIFVAYVVLLFIFGHVYSNLYANGRERFAFSSDVLTTRRQEMAFSEKRRSADLEELLNAIGELSDKLNDKQLSVHVSPTDPGFVDFHTSDFEDDFIFDSMWSGFNDNRGILGALLIVKNKKGIAIGSERVTLSGPDLSLQKKLSEADWETLVDTYFPPKTPDKFQEMIAPLRTSIARSLSEAKAYAEHPSDSSVQEWGYLDFLYFSAMTQTTVGYGDILPNSTIVRFCVTLQVLLGLFLIGVGISWVTSE